MGLREVGHKKLSSFRSQSSRREIIAYADSQREAASTRFPHRSVGSMRDRRGQARTRRLGTILSHRLDTFVAANELHTRK